MIHRLSIEIAGTEHQVSVEILGAGQFRLIEGSRSVQLAAQKVSSSARAATWSLLPEAGGRGSVIDVDGGLPNFTVTLVGGVPIPVKSVDGRERLAGRALAPPRSGPAVVSSPIPGKVVKVLVKVGDLVKVGQAVAVVEAMMMENELKATRDGRVSEVRVQEGAAVEAGPTLATLV